ncbi:zf-CCHC domain-containing protein [Tanacetum coccineum]
MDSDKYLEGKSMQRPPLFESDHFIYWKNRFETYVKAKDLDLWHIILNGDFPPIAKNEVTQVLEVVPFEEQSNDLKKKLTKYNKAKMVLYNALPKKEYERIFMCKTAKDIWQSLLITHQGNSQVKDNKIDLLVQQYEQFTILEEESIDSGFARFNTIITSLKALDEGFSSKNYVRKFLRALHPKWRAKVTAIEESDLSSLALDHLSQSKKKSNSDDETSTSGSDDEEYAMAKGKGDQNCFRCGNLNHLISDCPKPTRNKDQKAFIGGSWSNSENDVEDKTNDETCLMAQSSNELTLNSSYYSDNASCDNRRACLRVVNVALRVLVESSQMSPVISCPEIFHPGLTRAQSSRVPIPVLDDPYVAVRQARLVDTTLEPEEAPSEAEELQTARMTVARAQPVNVPCHIGQSDKGDGFCRFRFRKRIDLFTRHHLSSSSLAFPKQKRYQGTSEIILDTDSEEDEIEEEDTNEDEGHWLDDEGYRLDDGGHRLDDEDQSLGDQGRSLDEEGLGLKGIEERLCT